MTYPEEADVETPLEDAAEQATSAFPDSGDEDDDDRALDDEVPEWDAREQSQPVVDLDDDYR
jgi:hypothetical protein